MPGGRTKVWADPNHEGRGKGRQSRRFCSKCGNTIQQARILKHLNLCEFCVKELEARKDGVWSCRSCGKVTPEELKEHKGYCAACTCPACGKPDRWTIQKMGVCRECAAAIGAFCRSCGKEAAAQVRKNRGLCDACFQNKPKKETKPIMAVRKNNR